MPNKRATSFVNSPHNTPASNYSFSRSTPKRFQKKDRNAGKFTQHRYL